MLLSGLVASSPPDDLDRISRWAHLATPCCPKKGLPTAMLDWLTARVCSLLRRPYGFSPYFRQSTVLTTRIRRGVPTERRPARCNCRFPTQTCRFPACFALRWTLQFIPCMMDLYNIIGGKSYGTKFTQDLGTIDDFRQLSISARYAPKTSLQTAH